MGIGYQITDRHACDYQLYFIENGYLGLRGPRGYFGNEDFLVFTGAAQTFGRFVHQPFPEQVGRLTQQPFLNLGISGAGPEFYLKRPELLKLIGDGTIHFLQAMSARSVSAGLFECQGNNGVVRFLEGPRKNQTMMAAQAYQILQDEYGKSAYNEQVLAVQTRWIERNLKLIEKTETETYLVWISDCKIGENINQSSALGEFPHFVTKAMVDKIEAACLGVIDCSFENTRPQPVISDTSGQLIEVFDRKNFPLRPDHVRAFNVYYATPQHHDFITASIVRRLALDSRL